MDLIVDGAGRWSLAGWVGNLRVTTPDPLPEGAAREYARLLSESFGVIIVERVAD